MRRAAGFDLDMTLVDTRPGIKLALLALAEDTGRPIDADSIVAGLGPPIAEVLSPWFSTAELPQAVQGFRRHMADIGVANVQALPGAGEAVAAARENGYDVLVVTSKIEPLAVATLANAGLEVDHVVGDCWAESKAEPLKAANAICYVGDHPADMRAAVAAGIPGWGVTSGSSSAQELTEAGASNIGTSLAALPAWLGALSK